MRIFNKEVIEINVVFYLLVVAAVVFLWFTLTFMFKPIGKFLLRLWNDAKEEMTEESNKEKSNKQGEKKYE